MSQLGPTLRTVLISGVLALATLVGSGHVVRADQPPAAVDPQRAAPDALQPPAQGAPQIEHFEYWRARADAARQRVAQAELELRDAQAAFSRMRRRNHPRGEARIQIREARDDARKAYEAALHELEVELPAEARQAQVPREWVASQR